MKKRSGYLLVAIMAVIFLSLLWSGVLIVILGYSGDAANVYARRIRVRSTLLSLSNVALRHLRNELSSGIRPKASSVEANEYLTDFNSLRIFSSNDLQGGMVDIFDLDYDPMNVDETKADLLLWGPACPYGYMIRATVKNRETASVTMESVFVVTPVDVPGQAPAFLLNRDPLYWRELFR